MVQLPTGTVTFLFTDIEGSTNLLQQLGDEYARALGEHQALLREAFAAHEGAEVDTQGDAFFVAFASTPQAVAAAVDATRALAAHGWPQGVTLRVRMGLHTGTPQLVGDHYVGLDVHRAARIAAAGHGGQVLLSQATCELVEHTLPAGVTLRALGLYRLKDLQQPERIFQLVLPGVPDAFPPLKTLDLRPHNLPVQPTPLLDRVEQLPALTALLRRADVRLVTLTGPGGIGKTRLAVQVAAELVEDFADGVWFVRLSRLVDPALVMPTIAQTLGLKETGSQSLADLLQAHVADKRLLLVLDNFEQVVGAAPELAALLGRSMGLRLLVTSRVSLHLRGEREHPLAPLPLPDPRHLPAPEQLSQYAAVALFIERAQATRPDFAVTAANAPAIAAICARLDGLPLAIELAASRVRVLPPEALLARLSAQLKLLTGGTRDAEERQQTMRATIAWSEALLAPAERVLFQRLAVFVGGCTLEAAEAVCSAPERAAPLELDVLEGLSTLVDHSLLQQREEGGEAEPRFGMLHVLREYALEQLEASGEAEALHRAHAAHFLELAERAAPEVDGPEAERWLDLLEREHDNLRAALGWARDEARAHRGVEGVEEVEMGLRLVAAVGVFWALRSHLREGRPWIEEFLVLEAEVAAEAADPRDASRTVGPARLVSGGVRASALERGGALAFHQGEYAAAQIQLEQALPLAQASGDLRTAADAVSKLGSIAQRQGDLERARACFAESLELYRELGEQRGIAAALTNLGGIAYAQRDLEQAVAAQTEALALFREARFRRGIMVSLANLSDVARLRGELAKAESLGREALALSNELGNPRRCAEMLEDLARVAGAAGQGERAAQLLGAAAAVRVTLGAPQPPDERADTEQAVAPVRATLGEAAWAAAFTAGQALSLERAIAEALGDEMLGGDVRAMP